MEVLMLRPSVALRVPVSVAVLTIGGNAIASVTENVPESLPVTDTRTPEMSVAEMLPVSVDAMVPDTDEVSVALNVPESTTGMVL